MNTMAEIEIENAGLILVAPFLPRFFRNMGYLDVMRFSNNETHARAIYLLEHMANGNSAISQNLTLNAILCGWPPNQPVPASPSLDEMEKQQSDHILKAVLAHWTALKEMTINDLREKFIRRKGILKMTPSVSLTVEPRAQDHLLRELPWIYALTGTPWSEQIVVHWNN